MADEPLTPPGSAAGGSTEVPIAPPAADTSLLDGLQERLLDLERQNAEKDTEIAALHETVHALQSVAALPSLAADEADTLSILAAAGVGSSFLKERGGNWRVQYVTENGTTLSLTGQSLAAAMAGHGQQHVHPVAVDE